MDVVLGVAVTGRVARLALVGSGATGVIDQSVVDVADNPVPKLTETVVGTNRLLADDNHRLVATRLCWTDHPKANQLRRALEDSGVHNVVVLSESEAATALLGTSRPGSAVLLVGDETATLSAPGSDDAPPTLLAAAPLAGADDTAAFDTLMARLGERPDTPQDVLVVGTSTEATERFAGQFQTTSTMRVQTVEDPTFALARGAAMSAALAGDATAMSPAMSPAVSPGIPPAFDVTGRAAQIGPNLAYSMADDSGLLPMEEADEPEDDDRTRKAGVPFGLRRLAATDAVLGIAVAGSVARLALVGPGAGGSVAIKHLVLELPMYSFEPLIPAVVNAQQSLAAEGRSLVGTQVYSPDPAQADALCQALAGAGAPNVAVVSQLQAATALLHTILAGGGGPGSVLFLITDEAATLFALGADALASVLAAVGLEHAADAAAAAAAAADVFEDLLHYAQFVVDAAFLVGTAANLVEVADILRTKKHMRVAIPDDPAFALARGAALAAGPAVDAAAMSPATQMAPALPYAPDATAMAPASPYAPDATAMAPASPYAPDATAMAPATQAAAGATGISPTSGMGSSPAEQQLAYSMAGDDELLPADGLDEFDDEYDDGEADTGPVPLSRRSLLLGNAVVAFAVIGFATLAVAVAVVVRPAAAQEPVVGLQNAAPGNFMPLLPTQQQAPVPAPPSDQPNAGYQGGVIADSNGYIPAPSVSPGAVGTPAPVAPPNVPAFTPNPNLPIPIPIIIPWPGWRPYYPPYRPPYVTTTPPTQPVVTTTPPTQPVVTTTPPTQPPVTTTPPTTAVVTTPPTTAAVTTPPTTAAPKPTTTAAPVPTTAAPAPTTAAPAPTTAAPAPKPTQTVAPQPTAAPKPPTQQPQTVAPKPPTQQPQTVAPKPPTQAPKSH
jgi:hypothetical protein